jgi:NitT/TauT family transport system ATP-binding protein
VAPRFAELRTHVYEQIQAAKRGKADPESGKADPADRP